MRRCFARRASRKVEVRQRTRKRLGLEALEDRTLLSAGGLAPQLLLTMKSGAVQTVKLGSVANVASALASYQANSRVQSAEVDAQVSVATVTNDALLDSQWALCNTGQSGGVADADIDADQAWDVQTGSLNTRVAVIDTGIDYTHVDLYKNIWLNQGELPTDLQITDTDLDGLTTFWDLNDAANAGKVNDANQNGRIDGYDVLRDTRWANRRDNDGNGKVDDLIGWDFVNNDNNPFDDNGHGTHVSGTIGALANNGTGVVGVNWKVLLVPLKFLDASGSGYTSAAVNALNYAVAEGIKISNNSWGGADNSRTLAAAIETARAAGHIFVTAAGNDGANNDVRASYPANYSSDNILSVAATDSSDQLARYSNYGVSRVDLAAPGVSIISTVPGDSYETYGGTSMAVPHVVGAVALVWSADPTLTYQQVVSRILNGVDQLSTLSGKVASGGRLNVHNALLATVGTTPSDTLAPTVISAVGDSATSLSSIRLTFSEAIDPATLTVADVGLEGPQGDVAITAVTPVVGSNNTQFDCGFAAQTTAGTYRLSVGPEISDVAGNVMDQDANGTGGESTDVYETSFTVSDAPSVAVFSATPAAAIRDLRTTTSTITVDHDLKISDLNVVLDISHTWDADLRITLTSPTGKTIVLVNRRGGGGDNFTNTTLDDEATVSLRAGRAPFEGTYRADSALSAFDGGNARGVWTLRVQDTRRRDTGSLNSWSLIVTPAAATTATPARTSSTDAAFAQMCDGKWKSDQPTSESLRELATYVQRQIRRVNSSQQAVSFAAWRP